MSERLVAVITGGSNGIGEGICRHFLDKGAVVVNIDVQPPKSVNYADYRYVQTNLADAEATLPTPHPKLRVARARNCAHLPLDELARRHPIPDGR